MTSTSPPARATPVSIGIPTYNRPAGLRRTLDCILAQTYPALEILVSDNASTDGEVVRVCQEYAQRDPRVRIYRQSTNLGSTGNFQFLLRTASAPYFMWAADDDEWDPGFVAACVCELEQGAITAMTGSALHLRYAGKRLVQPVPHLPRTLSRAAAAAAFLRRPYPSMIYGIHRRSEILDFLTETSWFDYYDCYFMVKLLLRGPAVVNPEVLFAAGVDAPQYEVKTLGKSLRFAPFCCATLAAIDGAGLTAGERRWLKTLTLLTTARMILSYWKSRLLAVRGVAT